MIKPGSVPQPATTHQQHPPHQSHQLPDVLRPLVPRGPTHPTPLTAGAGKPLPPTSVGWVGFGVVELLRRGTGPATATVPSVGESDEPETRWQTFAGWHRTPALYREVYDRTV